MTRGRHRDANPSPNALKLRRIREHRRRLGICQFCPARGTVGPQGGAPLCDGCRAKIAERREERAVE